MLTEELALTIVNKLMAVLGKNINLMDKNGYIIASGDKARVGSFHQGSVQVMKTRRPLEIKQSDLLVLQGVRQGINLPITFENQVVGAVGITGEPSEVRGYGELVRYTVEMMLEQAALKEEVHQQERARDIFFQDLISGNWGDEKLFIMRGRLIGMNLEVPRRALVLDFLTERVEATLPEQRVLSTATSAVQSHFFLSGGIVGTVGTARLVLLTPVREDVSVEQQCNEMEKTVFQLRKLVEKHTKARFMIGIGDYSEGLEGLKRSYQESLAALEMGTRFCPGTNTHYYGQMKLEQMIVTFPQEKGEAFVKAILGPLLGEDNDPSRPSQLLETLEVYLDRGLNVKCASEKLYVHRNTLMHRLKRIEQKIGLKPYVFEDAFKLRLAVLLSRAHKEN